MATMQHIIFFVRELIKTESATAMQRAFHRRFNIEPLSTTLVHLKNRMTTVVNSVTQNILRVWDEFGYRHVVIRAAGI
jgi:hypothetical protein